MTSATKIAAVRVARSLPPAELATNQAALKILAMGAAILTPRADGTFHPLEGQAAVEHVGQATQQIFGALASIKAAHGALREVAARHRIVGEGIFEDTPMPGAETGHLSEGQVVVATRAA